MSGIICWICLTLAISVLQFAPLRWQNELNKNQEKNVSQPNRDPWWIWPQERLRSCLLQLHQTRWGPRMDIKILENLLQVTIERWNLCNRHNQIIHKRICGGLKNSEVRMSRYLDTSSTTPVAKIMVQHGRPSRSSWTKSVWWSFGRTTTGKAIRESPSGQRLGESSELGMFICQPSKRTILLSVYVDDIKLAGKTEDISPTWKILVKDVDLGEPTSFLDHMYLGCAQREKMPNKQGYCGKL